ncbi:uncharacterized protein A1O9_09955 [Exophiala aquamarina CBS 119918]|uniref:Uncharacterized protein n=1 Tax=Exophiala aquamarina CBS 119918 TaxID=1182545 RepID=A0A072PF08_9EURO|nr:uncharacterized protein A1O9_09955 [Exophiala aquamarina CBS 119918]KEF54160.1 hypothetical protein A1O9_09955 [Exophiala aquamarina CBS 119918]
MANMYALLAISAHGLACAPDDSSETLEYWRQLSTQTSTQAKDRDAAFIDIHHIVDVDSENPWIHIPNSSIEENDKRCIQGPNHAVNRLLLRLGPLTYPFGLKRVRFAWRGFCIFAGVLKIQALQDFDVALAFRNQAGPGTVWPAFMAGCEALTEARRDRLKQWIEKGFATSGFFALKVARKPWLMYGPHVML